MAMSLKKKIKKETITIKNKKYIYINSFDAEDIFVGYSSSDYHPVYLSNFLAVIPLDVRRKILREKGKIEVQKTEIEKIQEQEAYWRNKNSFRNIIKIT